MSDVKRYTLVDGLLRLSEHPTAIEEAARTHSLFTGEKQVVLAADYDTVAAQIATRDRQLVESVDHEAQYTARIAQLEQELAQYKQQHQFNGYADRALAKVGGLEDRVKQLEARVSAMQHVVNMASLLHGPDDDSDDGDDFEALIELYFAVQEYRATLAPKEPK